MAGVITSDSGDEFEREQEHLIKITKRKNRLFFEGEIYNRLIETKKEMWFLPLLSGNDVTLWDKIRLTNFIDSMNQLIVILENQ